MEYSLLYYDLDGDGIFERIEDVGNRVGLLTPEIPEWVLRSK